jgi:opacity protein-like surface antigen
MTRVRLGLAAALVALVAGGTVAASAVAAPGGAAHGSTYSLHTIQVHGAAKGGKKFTGSYAIQHFTVRNNKVYAVGTLTGTLKNRHVSRSNVQLPAKLVAPSSTQTSHKSTRQAATGGQCTILHLVLGPINLNLLGLNVTLGGGNVVPGNPATEPITLNLTGDPNGGLLGSLLCGLDNAIGGSGSTAGILSQLSTQLNQLASTLTSLVALLP